MLYETWFLAKTYRCRPSELLHIHDEVAAYHLDRAVAVFGTALDNELDERTEGAKTRKDARAKARLVLDKWLREPEEEQEEVTEKRVGGFRAPVPIRRRG